jgi:hypothetical protein
MAMSAAEISHLRHVPELNTRPADLWMRMSELADGPVEPCHDEKPSISAADAAIEVYAVKPGDDDAKDPLTGINHRAAGMTPRRLIPTGGKHDS